MSRVPEGQFTATVYGLIKKQNYNEAVKVLLANTTPDNKSRQLLSLLGYCYFYLQDFLAAAECYEQLVQICPEVTSYRLYYSQCLQRACMYEEAMSSSSLIDDQKYRVKVIQLQAAIKYGEEDIASARALIELCPPDDPDTVINQGCLLYMEKHYDTAIAKFNEALNLVGAKPQLCYNLALCHYRLKQYAPSLKYIADVIESGIRDHPELSVGMATEGIDVRSVGNTQVLHESALVEAFNLKAAIEYDLKNLSAAGEALTDMPPRSEEELDSVTLHNSALIHMNDDPTGGFEKLQFLLSLPACPPETFGNLLLLYCKYQHYDLAADVLAENADLTFDLLSQDVYDFLDAVITLQTSSDEAFKKFDDISNAQIDRLRKLTKQIQEARSHQSEESIKRFVTEYDDILEKYIPVLMAQAKIFWDLANYAQVEKLFRKSVEFCNENDVWKLNVAHVLFMQESKYKEAIGFYEPIVKKNFDAILDISPIVIANLCVAYIMSSQNEDAEELMRKIEKEEEGLAYEDPEKKVYHLCIINLVIGTLYCAKGNFQFGVSRIIKSLEPYSKKLSFETWFYAKRCFLALIENLAKHLIILPDSTIEEITEFLDACQIHGRHVSTMEESPLQREVFDAAKCTVTFEARVLKTMILRLLDH